MLGHANSATFAPRDWFWRRRERVRLGIWHLLRNGIVHPKPLIRACRDITLIFNNDTSCLETADFSDSPEHSEDDVDVGGDHGVGSDSGDMEVGDEANRPSRVLDTGSDSEFDPGELPPRRLFQYMVGAEHIRLVFPARRYDLSSDEKRDTNGDEAVVKVAVADFARFLKILPLKANATKEKATGQTVTLYTLRASDLAIPDDPRRSKIARFEEQVREKVRENIRDRWVFRGLKEFWAEELGDKADEPILGYEEYCEEAYRARMCAWEKYSHVGKDAFLAAVDNGWMPNGPMEDDPDWDDYPGMEMLNQVYDDHDSEDESELYW